MKFTEGHIAVVAGIGLLIAAISFLKTYREVTSLRTAFTSGNVRNVVGMVGCAIYLGWWFFAHRPT